MVGEIENGMQCLGYDGLTARTLRGDFNSSNYDYQRASIAGWAPKDDGTTVDTAINCIGAIPLLGKAGYLAKGAKATGKAIGKPTLTASAHKYQELFSVFDTSFRPDRFEQGLADISRLFPNNAEVAQYSKAVYDSLVGRMDAWQAGGGAMGTSRWTPTVR